MDLCAGQQVGRWRLVEVLGAGGMGEVWRAEPADVPGGAGAALKLLLEASVDAGGRQRFAREAKTLLALDHANVVRAFDFGEAGDGTLYLAMEILVGESLAERLSREIQLPSGEAVRIGRGAAAGLAAAHACGLAHRDVKPGNIFLCSDGGVKVLDFGLVVRAGAVPGAGWTRMTRPGHIIGTPSYMAPEQAAGAQTEDARTDVWSLGATLYNTLAGRPPFWAGGNFAAELFRILTEPPAPLPSELPAPLREVIARALEKSPAQRWPSMDEMAAALERAGRALDALGRDATMVAALPPALAEEVRLVAALVALDVRDAAALLSEVRRRGGVGAALRSGEVVAVFGGAEWNGDEPEQAVRAALAARAHGAWLGVGTGKAVRPAAQGAMVTGEAVAAAQHAIAEIRATGDPEQVAAEASANGAIRRGAVAACPETRRRILGAFTVRGAAVTGEVPGGRALAVRDTGGIEIPMLGRDAEFRQLVDLVERSSEEGRAGAALVVGAPGIGKSRLLYEVDRWLVGTSRPHRRLVARGDPSRVTSPFAALATALQEAAAVPRGMPNAEACERIASLVVSAVGRVPQARRTAEFLGELLGVPFPESESLRAARAEPRAMGDQIRLAVGALLEGWAVQGLLVLQVEDLQFVDTPSLEVLQVLAARLDDRPFVLIAAARPEALADRPDPIPAAERIDLQDLSERHMEAVARHVLSRTTRGGADLDAVARGIAKRAAGNPFFAEELALAVRDGADPDALPLSVEGAVQARLDRLPAQEKDLLKRASVFGQRFWVEAIERLGAPEAPHLLASLRRRDLVHPRPESRLAGCREWMLRHAVVQEVAYGLLTEGQRRSLHAVAAAWLGERPDAAAEEIAEHHERAGAAGAARPFWVRATHDAWARSAMDRVLACSERALAPGPGGDGISGAGAHELRLLRVDAHFWLRRAADEADELDALDAAGARAEAAGTAIDDASRSRAQFLWAQFLGRGGRTAEATARARLALVHAERAHHAGSISRARASLAARLVEAGRAAEASVEAEAAVAAAGEDAIARAIALDLRGYVAASSAMHERAIAAWADARAAFEAVGLARSAALTVANEGALRLDLGDLAGAKRALEQALLGARALGIRLTEVVALANLGLVLARLGDPAAGRTALDQIRTLVQEGRVADGGVAIMGLVHGALIRREAGDAAGALTDASEALAAMARSWPPGLAAARAARAAALLDLGRPEEALVDADEAVAALDTRDGIESMEIDILLVRHDALAALGRTRDAAAALAKARRCFDELYARLEDPAFRRTFAENIPAHVRLLRLTGAPSL